MKLSKQTISERATDLINLSIANCNELSKQEERNKLPTQERERIKNNSEVPYFTL